jgi:uncharacterized membrane protein YtjA (UPF0391 family)
MEATFSLMPYVGGSPDRRTFLSFGNEPEAGKGDVMLSWTIALLVIAIIAAILGFGGIAGTAAGLAKILFFVFLVLFVLSLLFGRRSV